MGLKPSSPAPPDYTAAAKEQGVANTNSALATNWLNQVNQVGPDGSLTFSYSQPGVPTGGSPGGYDPETGQYTPPTAGTQDPNGGHYLPDGTYIPATTATTTLSPEQQKLYDQNNLLGSSLNDLAIRGVDYVDDATSNPLKSGDFRGVSYAGPGTQTNAGAYQTGDGTSGLMSQYDFSKAGAMPSSSDFTADRDLVTQALLERMQPQLDQDRDRLDTRLANQGINLGSQAYGDANFNQQRGVNDARIAALLAGSQEQQRMFQNAMGIRQQGVGEAINQGNFNNASVGQRFGQGLAANQQNFQQDLGANNQNFNMGLAQNQFNNGALGQDVQMADFFQNQPLNVLNALRTGNQVSMPQFQNQATGAQIAPPPIYAAANDQYSAALKAYETKSGMFGDFLGGLGKLGSTALPLIAASDRRVKKNILPLGARPDGLGLYAFEYLWGGGTQVGYMADEVELLYPDAVIHGPFGFAMVDYGRVG